MTTTQSAARAAQPESILEEAIRILESCELKSEEGERLIDLSLDYLARKHRRDANHVDQKPLATGRWWRRWQGKSRRYADLAIVRRLKDRSSGGSLIVQRPLSYDTASAMLFADQ